MKGLNTRILSAGLVYFGIVFGVGFMLGAVRVPWLVPRLGVRTAELLEMPLMWLAIVLAARTVVRRFAIERAARPRLAVGAIALAGLVGAELLLAVALSDRTLGQYLASRDPVSGTVYLLSLGAFALMPWWLALREAPGRQ